MPKLSEHRLTFDRLTDTNLPAINVRQHALRGDDAAEGALPEPAAAVGAGRAVAAGAGAERPRDRGHLPGVGRRRRGQRTQGEDR